MTSLNHRLAWILFLIVAGLFLLLKNLGIFGVWGEAVWGGLFLIAGVGFLAWFIFDAKRFWRGIAGFLLLSVAAVVLLTWQGVDLTHWRASLIMLGLALGFWAVFAANGENWWALIPAGTLSLVAVLLGLQARLNEMAWLGLFFLGLGVVFTLVYLLRLKQYDTGWAGIPAAALLLIGIVTLADVTTLPQAVLQWWPVLLVVAGMSGLLLFIGGQLATRSLPPTPTSAPEVVAPLPAPRMEVPAPAPGTDTAPSPAATTAPAPVAVAVPTPAVEPVAVSAAPSGQEAAPDKALAPAEPSDAPESEPTEIYELLAQQPQESDEQR